MFGVYFVCSLSPFRLLASMFLEKQIKKIDNYVSGFENKLAKDGVILSEEKALQTRINNLQVHVESSKPIKTTHESAERQTKM